MCQALWWTKTTKTLLSGCLYRSENHTNWSTTLVQTLINHLLPEGTKTGYRNIKHRPPPASAKIYFDTKAADLYTAHFTGGDAETQEAEEKS